MYADNDRVNPQHSHKAPSTSSPSCILTASSWLSFFVATPLRVINQSYIKAGAWQRMEPERSANASDAAEQKSPRI